MSTVATVPTTASRVREVSPAELKAALDRGEVTLIDVREPAEHAGERIAGARLMPLGAFDPAKAREYAAGKMLVLHCKSSGRSGKAAKSLLAAGAEEACHLCGGIDAWKQAGLPVERDANAPISMFRQVQITAGSLVLIGSVLGYFVSPWFIGLSAFVGAGLVFAGISNTCGMAMVLSRMPWNNR
jgi:rhodanese-related sulfurtransferase